jgi:hypothetical protein
MQIGRERATVKRLVAVSIGIAVASATWFFWWPSASACRSGDVEACKLRAWAGVIPAYFPMGMLSGDRVSIEWPDARGRVVETTTEPVAALAMLRPMAEPIIATRLAVCAGIIAALMITVYLLWGRLFEREKPEKETEILRGSRVLSEKDMAKKYGEKK